MNPFNFETGKRFPSNLEEEEGVKQALRQGSKEGI
jgi:hypothetical protein